MSRARGRGLLGAAVMALGVTACAETQANIVLTLDEYTISAEPASAEEGNVLIDIDNTGSQQHELLIVRSGDPATLPVTDDGRVDLAQLVIIDQVEPMPPGRFRVLTPDTRFGQYVLFCNLATPGPDGQPVSHFASGMHTVITIEQIDPVTDDTEDPQP